MRLADGGYPPVTGLKARIGGRELFVPVDRIADAGARRGAPVGREAQPRALRAARGGGAARPGRARAQARQRRGRPAAPGHRARDRAGLHRGLVAGGRRRSQHARAAAAAAAAARCAAWSPTGRSSTGPTWSRSSGTCPRARLRFSHRKLANLHPAEIADLVEAASHEEGEEIIEAVGQDRELEADVFEELDEHHQLEFIRERPDAQVAAVIARMAADDAADLIVEIDQERRGRVLALLPAGAAPPDRSAARLQPLDRGRPDEPGLHRLAARPTRSRGRSSGCARSDLAPGTLTHRLPARRRGPAVGLGCGRHAAARRSASGRCTRSPSTSRSRSRTDADLPEVARTMTDYNLVMLAVVDEDERMVGVDHRRRRARADAADRLAAALRGRQRLTAQLGALRSAEAPAL